MKPLQPPPVSMLDKYRGHDILPLYTTSVNVTGGEAEHARTSGIARSDDGNLEVTMRLPEELGGNGDGANPEQMFAAAYATCFHGAMSLLATKANLQIAGSSVTVIVTFGRDPVDGMYLLTADVRVYLPGLAQAKAEELIRQTERVCPYAKMARQGIESVVGLAQ